ncbi:MAG: DUF2303 family protein [Gallionellaceae bacterium]|jgi:uncharacterized protein YfdQ (DUF2303 family)
MSEALKENIAETVARETRKPFDLRPNQVAVPAGWEVKDTEHLLAAPRRKKARVGIATTLDFIDYLKRHGSLASCTIWCEADYPIGKVEYTAILNDHLEDKDGQQWRDHIATYTPAKSVEWKHWNDMNGKPMDQMAFANFLETNLADIASAEGYPTGTDMLTMATGLEIIQDSRIKSAVRIQSGGVRVEYVDDANADTAKSMEVFSKFALGLPVFWGGDAYQVEARLKYKLREGKLTFWYELTRPDKTLEHAAQSITESIKAGTGFPMFHGNPFAK